MHPVFLAVLLAFAGVQAGVAARISAWNAAGIPPGNAAAAPAAAVSVERIFDRAGHSAFTDICRFKGRLYVCFREGSGHVPGLNGTVRIIVSGDGLNWRSAALLDEEGVDLRDPKLSVTPDGRLMVLMGGSVYAGGRLLKMGPRVSFFSGAAEEGFSRLFPWNSRRRGGPKPAGAGSGG